MIYKDDIMQREVTEICTGELVDGRDIAGKKPQSNVLTPNTSKKKCFFDCFRLLIAQIQRLDRGTYMP